MIAKDIALIPIVDSIVLVVFHPDKSDAESLHIDAVSAGECLVSDSIDIVLT